MDKRLRYSLLIWLPFWFSHAWAVPNNSAPVISGTPQATINANATYYFQPTASDADSGDKLKFTVVKKPAWATFNTVTGALTGTPKSTQAGIYKGIVITVSDGKNKTSLPEFSIQVENPPPVIEGVPNTAVVTGNTYRFVPIATDSNGDKLVFSITQKPAWAKFSSTTGELTGIPKGNQSGVYSGIVITVSDGKNKVSLPEFSIRVDNLPPTISGTPDKTAIVGKAYRFVPTAADPNGDALEFTIQGKPSWAKFDSKTGALTGTPTAKNGGISTVTITVSDGKNSLSLPTFELQVVTSNRLPTLSGTPLPKVVVGQPYYFMPVATDPDSDTLAFTITNKPSWATFDQKTGALSGNPALENIGITRGIVISVSDNKGGSASLTAFDLEVTEFALSYSEAHRLLVQASFGPTSDTIQEVMKIGAESWVDQQLAKTSAYDNTQDAHQTHLERTINIALSAEPTKDWTINTVFNQTAASNNVNDYQMAAWWENALGHPVNTAHGSDPLRQRIAYALSQLLVTSQVEAPLDQRGEGLAFYYDIMARNAFGNYRTLLGEVARSPAMGIYLSHQGNRKADLKAATRPDENFARELIQLFSIGLYELNLDGSPNRDGNADTYPDSGTNVVPTYTQEDVSEMAKVMTGWDLVGNTRYGHRGSTQGNYTTYMEFTPSEHENEVAESGDGYVTIMGKRFSLTSGTDGSGLDAALDLLFQHPNISPFVSRHLIMRLVTSNPSSAYIARIAAVFNNNGAGIRGDLKAVVRAILLDEEARSITKAQAPTFGKAKEPILALTQFLRAFQVQPLNDWISRDKTTPVNGVYWYRAPQSQLGQAPLRASSVFNFYSSDFIPSDSYFSDNQLVAPELQIQTDPILVEINNRIFNIMNNYEKNKIEKINKKILSDYAKSKNYFSGELWLINFDKELEIYEQALDGDSNKDFANMELKNPSTGIRYKVQAIDVLLEHLNQLLLGGSMTTEYRAALKLYLMNGTGSQYSDNFLEAWVNIKDAVRLIVASNAFMIQK
jgi:uncharacterized protein (DUF1800 family)